MISKDWRNLLLRQAQHQYFSPVQASLDATEWEESPSCQVDNFPLQRRHCSAVSITLTALDVIDQIQNGRCFSVYVECGDKITQLGAISLYSSCSRSGIRHEKVQCLDGRRHDGRYQTFSDKVSPGDGVFIKLVIIAS